MIISFAKTSSALLAGVKTVTRRDWNPVHAAKFIKDDIVDAWNKSPRFGGMFIARIKLKVTPYLENIYLAPDDDYYNEGFQYMCNKGIKIDKFGLPDQDYWLQWKLSNKFLYVIRFELMYVQIELIGKYIVYPVRCTDRMDHLCCNSIYDVTPAGDYINSCNGIVKKSKVIGIFDTYDDAKREFPEIYN